jgi:sulfatase-like protein
LRWTDCAVAFSLANLVYVRVWAEVLNLNGDSIYWLKTPPTPTHVIALIVNVFLLGVLLLCWVTALRYGRALALWLVPVGGLLILISIANSLRALGVPGTSVFLRFAVDRLPMLGVAVGGLSVLALRFWGLRVLRPVYTVLLILSPLVVLFVGQAVYRVYEFDASTTMDGPMAGGLPTKPIAAPRVVWVIFDEWDQELTFEDRPTHIHLPEIDRLVETSFSATSAATPGPYTDWSMPALIMGTALADVRTKGASELMFRAKNDDRWLPWSREDNVFRRAREMGFNTAVVGWAIPYCRVLKADLSDCWWWSGSNQYNSAGRTIPELIVGQPRSLFESEYRSPFGQSLSTKRHMWDYDSVLAQAVKVVGDPQYGLVLLHLPVPHPPYFFSAATGRNDWGDTPLVGILKQTHQGYLSALVLTDRTVGILRSAMEQGGLWEGTTVIWSADHPFRHRPALDGKTVSHRVPYLIKPAGVGQPVRYERPFSALMTRKLIEAFLSREITRGGQIADWIDRHRTG